MCFKKVNYVSFGPQKNATMHFAEEHCFGCASALCGCGLMNIILIIKYSLGLRDITSWKSQAD